MANELRLLFDKADGAPTVRLVSHAGGGTDAAVPFELDLSEDDYEDLRWYLESYMDLPDGGSVVRAQRIEEQLRTWGRTLYDTLFDRGNHRELLLELLDGETPRLLTVATQDPDLLRLPWELIADRRGPLSRQGVTVRRQLEQAGRPLKYRIELPLRILMVVSRPADLGFIDPRLTTPTVLDALEPLGGDVALDFCRPPTVARMEEMLSEAQDRSESYHVVHFEGHGTFLPDIGLGALCFEKSTDGGAETDFARADRLGNLLAAYRIPVALLEACRTSMTGKVSAFRSVAPRLVEAGVGSVVAMSHAVHVEATRILFERFYRELVAGKTIGQALEAGRGALLAQPHRWMERRPGGRTVELRDWFLPTLYQQGQDLALVPRDAVGTGNAAPAGGQVAGARRQPAARGEPGAFPRPPAYQFHGRAAELYKLERELRGHRTVLLHAMGGMGKTTLAREAAYWWTRTGLFPDGACFMSFEQGVGADQVALVLGTYLEGTAFESQPAVEQVARARELFDGRRVLVVWDNFESVLPTFQQGEVPTLYSEEERGRIVELYRDWTESPRGAGRLLVTCRPAEAGLAGARKMELHGLARADSLHLLARVLEVHGMELDDPRLDRDGLEKLLGALGDHPLSIELTAPHLATMTPSAIIDDFAALVETFHGEAEVERNRSLLASLEFSTRRLGEAARAALPWLGLFRSGVFEQVLLDVSEFDPGAWEAARQELEATALVRAEREILFGEPPGRPYLRFHPTLAYRAKAEAPTSDKVRQRFVAVYLGVMSVVDQAFFGSNPKEAMEMMAREEANFRTAVGWALDAEAYDEASYLGDTFAGYLQRSGRLRERDSWVGWLAGEVGKGGFSEAMAKQERDAAWSLFTQGHAQKAVARLEDLMERLQAVRDFDAASQLAHVQTMLGRMHVNAGLASKAVPILENAVERWQTLVDREKMKGEKGSSEKANLSMALGDLANALRGAGRLDDALATAERALVLNRELGRNSEIAASLSIAALILARQGRVEDADAHYQEALMAARRAGDRSLEATTLQNRGILSADRGRHAQAIEYYRRALKLFQEMHAEDGVMMVSHLLGVVDGKAGRLAEARVWHERSREIAERRKDQRALATAAQNLGIILQMEGEAATKNHDENTAKQRFDEAAVSVQQSLKIAKGMSDEQGVAVSYGQLAQIQLLRDNLEQAEELAHQAREIYEHLGLKEAYKEYGTLARIARARGDDAQTTEWQRKRDDLIAELKRRAGGTGGLPPQAVQSILSLAAACARAGLESENLPPAAESALAHLAESLTPLPSVASFLRGLAAGEPVSVPAGLPPELSEGLGQLLAAVGEARG